MIPPMGSRHREVGNAPRNSTGSRIVYGVIALLAVLLLWQGDLFRPVSWTNDPGNSGRMFPGMVLCLTAASALWLALVGDGQALQRWPVRRLLAVTALVVGLLLFAQLFRPLGWALSSTLVLVILPLALGYRSVRGIVFFGLPVLILVWVVFVLTMGVQLPPGTVFR